MAAVKNKTSKETKAPTEALSLHLTHPYPMWEGCTFQEMILLSVTVIIGLIGCALLGSLFMGNFRAWLLGMVILIYPCIKIAAKQLAKFKRGKPHHYVLLSLGKRFGLHKDKYFNHSGAFDTRRTFALEE